jgi:hypothetical protein
VGASWVTKILFTLRNLSVAISFISALTKIS